MSEETVVEIPVRETDEWQRRVMYRLTRDNVSVDEVYIEQETEQSTAWPTEPSNPYSCRLSGDSGRVTVDQDSVFVSFPERPQEPGEYSVTVTLSAKSVTASFTETVDFR